MSLGINTDNHKKLFRMNIEHKAKRSPAPTEQALHTQTIISHSII